MEEMRDMSSVDSRSAQEERPEADGVKELLRCAPWLYRFSRRGDLLRVATTIGLMEIKLRHHRELCRPASCPGGSAPAAREAYGLACGGLTDADLEACGRLLREAKKALEIGAVDSAWMYVNELEREMLPALSDEELTARLTSAVEEAREKLSRWRGSAVPRLSAAFGLAGEGVPEGPVEDAPGAAGLRRATLAALRETLYHLHSNAHNMYRNINQLRLQVAVASLSVAVMLAAVWVLNARGFFAALGDGVQDRIPMAIISGLLGGVLSVAHNVSKVDPKRKIPEVKASFLVTLARPIVGAAVAVPVLAVVESGLINIPGEHRLWAILAFCFLAGFSERWFFGIMEKLEKQRT
jgi:hypothetical protein